MSFVDSNRSTDPPNFNSLLAVGMAAASSEVALVTGSKLRSPAGHAVDDACRNISSETLKQALGGSGVHNPTALETFQ